MSEISLKRATTSDAELIHRWRSEPSRSRFQPALPLTLDEVRAMLDERSKPAVEPTAIGKFQWLIVNDGDAVGWITLEIEPIGRRHGYGVIGYTIGEQHRAKGYGKAGLELLLPIAFGRTCLNLERLEAVAAFENSASRRVLEGNGFSHEGVLRGLLIIHGERVDHAIYGLLRTDWER